VTRREVTLAGVTYRAEREALRREGGEAGRWYAVRIDPRDGAVIDRTVPPGYFRTMRECHGAIATHAYHLRTAAPGHGWTGERS